MLNITSKIIRNSDKFLSSTLGNEIVMMNTANGTYIGLNEVSSNIWNYLENEHTAAEIVDLLLTYYDVSRENCEPQTMDCLSKMEQQGIIVVL
jgi:Coenzyme PQQ synthesis protein D (PqqD)